MSAGLAGLLILAAWVIGFLWGKARHKEAMQDRLIELSDAFGNEGLSIEGDDLLAGFTGMALGLLPANHDEIRVRVTIFNERIKPPAPSVTKKSRKKTARQKG